MGTLIESCCTFPWLRDEDEEYEINDYVELTTPVRQIPHAADPRRTSKLTADHLWEKKARPEFLVNKPAWMLGKSRDPVVWRNYRSRITRIVNKAVADSNRADQQAQNQFS